MKILHRSNYGSRRAADYPPITDLADALVHQANGDDTKLQAYLEACRAVKDRYPKPKGGDKLAPKDPENR